MSTTVIRIEYAVNASNLSSHFDTNLTSVTFSGIGIDANGAAVRVIDVVGGDNLVTNVDEIIEKLKEKRLITAVYKKQDSKFITNESTKMGQCQ